MKASKVLLGLAYGLMVIACFQLPWAGPTTQVDPATTSLLVTMLTASP